MDTKALELAEREAWLDIYAAAPEASIRALGLSWRRMGEIGLLACRRIPVTDFNRSMVVGARRPVTAAELDAVAAWMEAHADPGWALQVAPAARSAALAAWIDGEGMAASGASWAKFTRTSEPVGSPHHGLEVRQVTAETAEAFGAVVQKGFSLPDGVGPWAAALCGRPGWSLYLAYVGEKPVAAGAAFVHDDAVWFGMDTTIAAHRRTGAQAALIARRIEDGRAAGLGKFTAETAQPIAGQATAGFCSSYRNYMRAGFMPAYVRANYKRGQPRIYAAPAARDVRVPPRT
jgi:hypothetical protein